MPHRVDEPSPAALNSLYLDPILQTPRAFFSRKTRRRCCLRRSLHRVVLVPGLKSSSSDDDAGDTIGHCAAMASEVSSHRHAMSGCILAGGRVVLLSGSQLLCNGGICLFKATCGALFHSSVGPIIISADDSRCWGRCLLFELKTKLTPLLTAGLWPKHVLSGRLWYKCLPNSREVQPFLQVPFRPRLYGPNLSRRAVGSGCAVTLASTLFGTTDGRGWTSVKSGGRYPRAANRIQRVGGPCDNKPRNKPRARGWQI